MDDLTNSTTVNSVGETTTTTVEPKTEPVVETVVEPQPTKQELLRQLSKENGVNLFDAEGIKKFKEFQDSQKSELEKSQELINSYKSKEAEWQSKRVEYESKLKASELGIAPDKLEDALKLAEGNPDNLTKVLERYPMFKNTKGVTIGVNDPSNNSRPTGNNDIEAYMASNPKYSKYIKK